VNVLITGAGSGLGAILARMLGERGDTVLTFNLEDGCDVRYPRDKLGHLKDWPLDVLINNAGVNRIDWLERFTDADWDAVMDTNAKGIFKMTQALLPNLAATKGTVVNIVSNAAHMPMTCSLAYNASKAAAHIMTQQLARELTPRYGITVFGVAPNKLKGTGMSADIEEQVIATRGWTREYAAEYQRRALLTGEETPPEKVAEFIAYLLASRDNHRFLTGCVLPYGA
jgi:NAD(P)-dependent dehydrogenase (short-subunit alcohol dehydrogenase family)